MCWNFIFLHKTDQKSRGVSYQKRKKNDKLQKGSRWFHFFLKPSNFGWITARNFSSLLKNTTKQFSNGQILPLKFQVTNSLILFLLKKKKGSVFERTIIRRNLNHSFLDVKPNCFYETTSLFSWNLVVYKFFLPNI